MTGANALIGISARALLCVKAVTGARRLVFAIVLILLGGTLFAENLRVQFIDVGQGDAILLQTDDHAVLVDAGQYQDAADYLGEHGVDLLDLAIATHGHADHVGGFPAVFETVQVRELWYNGQEHPTLTFERFLDAVLASEAEYREPARGDRAEFGNLAIEVLHPEGSAADYDGHLHDKNIVVRATYHEFSVMLTGDAEAELELELIELEDMVLESVVLKLGHHGSSTSSSREFLAAVSPAVVVYQAGEDNPYGHPHAEVITRIEETTQAEIYGTDVHGTVVIETDGIEYSVETSNGMRQPIQPHQFE